MADENDGGTVDATTEVPQQKEKGVKLLRKGERNKDKVIVALLAILSLALGLFLGNLFWGCDKCPNQATAVISETCPCAAGGSTATTKAKEEAFLPNCDVQVRACKLQAKAKLVAGGVEVDADKAETIDAVCEAKWEGYCKPSTRPATPTD